MYHKYSKNACLFLGELSPDPSMRQHSYHPSQLLSKMQAGPMHGTGLW